MNATLRALRALILLAPVACADLQPNGGVTVTNTNTNTATADTGAGGDDDGSDEGGDDGSEDPEPTGSDEDIFADGATLYLSRSIAPAGIDEAFMYGVGFGSENQDDWCTSDHAMTYDEDVLAWGIYLPAGDYFINAGRADACSSNDLDTWFNLEDSNSEFIWDAESGDGRALCVHSDGSSLSPGSFSKCNTLDDISREIREGDEEADADDEDEPTDDGSCSVKVAVDGDATVEGYSSYYGEVYLLPQDSSGNSIDDAYWPSGDWSAQSTSSLKDALAFSSGGTDSDTFTFTGATVDSVRINGGIWTSSSGSYVRWLSGAYSDSVAASLAVSVSCDGDEYESLTCSMSGNDIVCD